jgi:hypothetical protein
MPRRGTVVLLVLLAVNAAVAACGTKDAALGPQDTAGNWAGSTSQDKEVLFTVTPAGVAHATLTYVLEGSRCAYTSTVQIPTSPAIAISDGHFTVARTQIQSSLFVSGAGEFASSASATGTFLVQDGQCGDTLSLTWSATKQQD